MGVKRKGEERKESDKRGKGRGRGLEWMGGEGRKSERGRKKRKGEERRKERACRRFLKGTFCTASSLNRRVFLLGGQGRPPRAPCSLASAPPGSLCLTLWLQDVLTPTWDKTISLSSAREMKLVNLLESLCFSMEMVHQVPLPLKEKQEGHSTLSRLPVPSSTLSSNQSVTHRSGVWTLRGPPEYVYLACLISLLLLTHSVSPQDLHSEVFQGCD